MAAKKVKKPGRSVKVADPRSPVKPTPAALRNTIAEVGAVVANLKAPEQPGPGDLVYAMMHQFFAEGLPDGYAQEVLRRIEDAFVDRNEFRVTEAFEVAELLSDLEIPDLFDRCVAVRDAVAQVYNDQNAVSLDFLREATVAERKQFLARVPAITPAVARSLIGLLSFEECIFSDKSTQRVQQRLGLDPKGPATAKFFAELRELLAPFGHVPLLVGPHRAGGKVIEQPALSPASLLLRLMPAKKK